MKRFEITNSYAFLPATLLGCAPDEDLTRIIGRESPDHTHDGDWEHSQHVLQQPVCKSVLAFQNRHGIRTSYSGSNGKHDLTRVAWWVKDSVAAAM